jgi:class I fructose-bisphosphate aldolase
VRQVVESAGRALVLFSGGEKQGEDDVMAKARISMESGATGVIFGRNVWQRPFDEALALAREIHEMLRGYGA